MFPTRPKATRPTRSLRSAARAASLAAAVCLAACGGERAPRSQDRADAALSTDASADWKRPETCLQCHANAFEAWSGSHHFHAQRPVDPARDAGIFQAHERATDAAGRSYRFRVKADELGIVDESLGEGALAQAAAGPVVGVIGYEPLQQFLAPFPGGRLQAHALAWDPEAREWFNVFGAEPREPGEWGHWTGQGMNWNANCAYCHVTEYSKNYDIRADAYESGYAAAGVGCIQCHAGAERHVAEARAGTLNTSAARPPAVSMDSCASCHSRREELTPDGLRPGERYHDHYRLVLPDAQGAYFGNGLAREENFVYGSLMLSAMGHAGVSCMDCHEPHGDGLKLPVENGALCLQCHSNGNLGAPLIDPAAHSRHPAGSEGASCVACHMPERHYMQRDARRDHGFTIPDPLSTVARGEPSACAQCHADEGPDWALARFEELFPETPRLALQRRRGEAVAAAHAGDASAAPVLLGLFYEEKNPHWRAAYLRLLAPSAAAPEVAAAARRASESESALEREAALRVLAARPDGAQASARALADTALLVRVQAAEAFAPALDPAEPAFAEWRRYLDANADRPGGALRRAELALVDGDPALARDLALRAVRFDASSAELHYDAAILLDRVGDPDAALDLLARARQLDPALALIPYAQGLLHAEKGEPRQAALRLEEALALDPQAARWWYNLAIAYLRSGQAEKAAPSLERALELEPDNREFLDLKERHLAPGHRD